MDKTNREINESKGKKMSNNPNTFRWPKACLGCGNADHSILKSRPLVVREKMASGKRTTKEGTVTTYKEWKLEIPTLLCKECGKDPKEYLKIKFDELGPIFNFISPRYRKMFKVQNPHTSADGKRE